MKGLKLATGGTYDVTMNSGLVLPGLRYAETLSVEGKVCMLFMAPNGQPHVLNLSYIAVIAETEGGHIDEPVLGPGESES